MKWRDRRQSSNVEDQRRSGGRALGFKGGIGTMVLAVLLWGVFGIDPRTTIGVSQQLNSGSSNNTPVVDTEESARTKQFVQVVLADTEDTWQSIFSQAQIVPESFTHGSSAQRMHWFKVGLASGQLDQCDTFKQPI